MTTFQERQKSLFAHLDAVEIKHNIPKEDSETCLANYGVIDRQTYRKIKSEMKCFRGSESIFKRPQAPIGRCLRARQVPDYIKNPKKWVHYTLSDVTPDQMSDATNTATAMALLKELENKEAVESRMDISDGDIINQRPKFNLSATIKKESREEDNPITYKSSKVIMPEYVVGVTEKKQKRSKLNKDKQHQEKKQHLKLQHLYDDE